MDARQPTAQSAAVRNERIVWTGSQCDLPRFAESGARIIDCAGGTLAPGFHDAHVHLLAYAATLDAVDCRPDQVSSIADINRLISQRASRTPQGEWVTAWGYDPFYLAEGRHPTRWDLDQAAPDNPVRINHRSGHACVLNSLAMERVGISDSTDEPAGATIVRDLETGSPNGLLLEIEDFLDGRILRPPTSEMSSLIERAARRLLSFGVTSVQDATHTNSLERWNLFECLSTLTAPLPRITVMPGVDHVSDFTDAGLTFGSGNDRVRIGHAKLMVTASSGIPSLSLAKLKAAVDGCVSLGFPVAVHAVEADIVRAVAEVLTASPSPLTGEGRREGETAPHRIEHCSEAPPDVGWTLLRSARLPSSPNPDSYTTRETATWPKSPPRCSHTCIEPRHSLPVESVWPSHPMPL